jgi:hypothetical protein
MIFINTTYDSDEINTNFLLFLCIILMFLLLSVIAFSLLPKQPTSQLDDYINTVWSERLINSHIEEIKVGSIDSFDEIKSGDISSVSYHCKNERCSQIKFLIEDKNSKDHFIPVVIQLNKESYFIPMKDCQKISNTCSEEQESYPEQFEDLTIKQVHDNNYTVEVSSLEELKKNVSLEETQSYLDNIIEQSITISKKNYRVKEMLDVNNGNSYKEGWE